MTWALEYHYYIDYVITVPRTKFVLSKPSEQNNINSGNNVHGTLFYLFLFQWKMTVIRGAKFKYSMCTEWNEGEKISPKDDFSHSIPDSKRYLFHNRAQGRAGNVECMVLKFIFLKDI